MTYASTAFAEYQAITERKVVRVPNQDPVWMRAEGRRTEHVLPFTQVRIEPHNCLLEWIGQTSRGVPFPHTKIAPAEDYLEDQFRAKRTHGREGSSKIAQIQKATKVPDPRAS